jgi:hypothetical protein
MKLPSRNDTRISLGRILRVATWRDWIGAIAVALVSATLLVHVWNPHDSVPPIAAGESLFHIALALLTGLLAAFTPSTLFSNTTADSGDLTEPSDPTPAAFWVWGAAVLFCVWLAISAAWTIGRGNTRYAVNGFWQWTSLVIFAAAVSKLARRPRFQERCWKLTLCAILGILVYGYFDYAVLQPMLRAQLQQNPEAMFEQQGIIPGSAAEILLRNRVESTEMHSVFALANSLAGFLVIAWTLWLGSFLLHWLPSDPRMAAEAEQHGGAIDSNRIRWLMIAEIAVLSLLAMALLLTKSRTAWIAASLATVGLMGLHPLVRGRAKEFLKKYPTACLAGLAAFAVAIGVAIALIYAWDPLIIREAGKSLAYRLDYWGGASRLIAEEPIRGFGPLNFQSTYLRVKLPTAAESPADPHNFLLEIAHAGGIPLLIAAVLVGLLGIRFTLQRLARETATSAHGAGSPFASYDAVAKGDRIRREPSKSRAKQADNSSNDLTLAQTSLDGWAFWGSAAFAALGFFTWSFFTAGDMELVATIAVVTIGFAAAITACRSQAITGISHRFMRHGSYALAVALLAFVVHLLASGGWMLPGTMIVPMLLVGLLLSNTSNLNNLNNLNNTTRDEGHSNDREATQRKLQGTLVLGACALLAFWIGTMAWPLTRSAEASRRISDGLDSGPIGGLGTTGSVISPGVVRELVSADRWDPELPRVGMELCSRQLLGTVPRFLGASPRPLGSPSLGGGTLGETARREWEETMLAMRSEFLSRDPRHALAYGECGRAALRLASGEKTPEGRKRWLELASEDFGRGAEVFTASVEAQLQAAVASFLAGDDERAKRFCRRAIEVDGITLHADRKIKAAEIFWPKNLENPQSIPTESRLGPNQDLVRGEPALATLRRSLSL